MQNIVDKSLLTLMHMGCGVLDTKQGFCDVEGEVSEEEVHGEQKSCRIQWNNGTEQRLQLNVAGQIRLLRYYQQFTEKRSLLNSSHELIEKGLCALFKRKAVDMLAICAFRFTKAMFRNVFDTILLPFLSRRTMNYVLWGGGGNGEEPCSLALLCYYGGFPLTMIVMELDETAHQQCVTQRLPMLKNMISGSRITETSNETTLTFNESRVLFNNVDLTSTEAFNTVKRTMPNGASIGWTTNMGGILVDGHFAKMLAFGKPRQHVMIVGLLGHLWSNSDTDYFFSRHSPTPNSWPGMYGRCIRRKDWAKQTAYQALLCEQHPLLGKGKRQALKSIENEVHKKPQLGRGKRQRTV